MKPADWAWVGVGVGVLGYEAMAAKKKWDYMSEAMDKYRKNHPWIIYGCIGYLSAHLTRLIPRSIDPLHVMTQKIR
jgi:hypothetical protein